MKLTRRQLIGGAAVMAAMPGIPSAFATVKEETRDLVIVGGGLGGLSAANAAVNKGYKALVIEKLPFLGGAGIMPEGSLGINTKYQKAHGIKTTAQQVLDAALQFHHFRAQFPGDLPGDLPPRPGVHAVQFVPGQIHAPVIGRQGHGLRRSVKFMDAAEEDLLPAVIQQPHHVPHRHGQLQKVGVRRGDEHRGGETRRRLVPGLAQPYRFQRGHDHLLSDQQFHSVSTFPICSFRGFVTPFLAAMRPHFVPSP